MRVRRPRGAVSILFVVAMTVSVVTLIMLLNARTVTTVTMVNRYEFSEQAMLQAESVMAMTRAKISLDRDFGKNGETVVLGTKVPESENGAWAEVTFAPGAANRSQNNLGEPTQKFGEGGLILNSNMCQIVAVSHYRTKKVIAYCIVTGPPLPYSLAASGKLRTAGNTLIGGVENASALADGLQDEDLVEGGGVANGVTRPLREGEVPVPPMILESGVKVVGNAQSAGLSKTMAR